MKFVVCFEGSKEQGFSAFLPDLEFGACVGAGNSLEGCWEDMQSAISTFIESYLLDGDVLPKFAKLDDILHKEEYKDMLITLMDADVDLSVGKSKKINVTLPENLIKIIDKKVDKHGVKSRSAFIAKSCTQALSRLS